MTNDQNITMQLTCSANDITMGLVHSNLLHYYGCYHVKKYVYSKLFKSKAVIEYRYQSDVPYYLYEYLKLIFEANTLWWRMPVT